MNTKYGIRRLEDVLSERLGTEVDPHRQTTKLSRLRDNIQDGEDERREMAKRNQWPPAPLGKP